MEVNNHSKNLEDQISDLSLESTFNKKFLENRRVFFWGVVDDDSCKKAVNQLLFLEQEEPGKPIELYINSPGGVVTSGMIVYDAMQMISSPIHTYCMGMAASMGSVLLSGGAKGHRHIFPSGKVMIHQPSIGGVFRGSASDIQIRANEIQKTKDRLGKLLADNCGRDLESTLKDFDRDYWMDAGESKEYGIVDHIIDRLDF